MKEYTRVSHSFDMVIDKESKVLILGSFPSVKSLEQGFFYMNPQNRFYKVISKVFDDDFVNVDIKTKKELLIKHHIALYDVVMECDIVGSQDSTIRNVSYLDIEKIRSIADISKIYLNGNKAYSLFVEAYPELAYMAIKLPSTSPANAKMSIDDLIKEWSRLKDE